MKIGLIRNGEDVGSRVWKDLDVGVRFALLGLGLVRIGEDRRPVLDELPAATLRRVEKLCGVR